MDEWRIKQAIADAFYDEGPISDKRKGHRFIRHQCYRLFVRFIWGRLPKYDRKHLPSCMVNKVRSTYPAGREETYKGFITAAEAIVLKMRLSKLYQQSGVLPHVV